nr:Uncharacterised protein [Enterobacter ludwigii]
MTFFRYLRLRAAQQMLCVSFSLPVAILLATVFSPFGTWSVPCFFVWFMTLMVLTWGGLRSIRGIMTVSASLLTHG